MDVPYECHIPEMTEIRPSFNSHRGETVTGRHVTEFGRPGVNTYFGVPYAKKAIGNLRFMKPEIPEVTSQVDAGLFKMECSTNLQDSDYTSEDCLYLDIWQPPKASNKYRNSGQFFCQFRQINFN